MKNVERAVATTVAAVSRNSKLPISDSSTPRIRLELLYTVMLPPPVPPRIIINTSRVTRGYREPSLVQWYLRG